MGAQHWWPAGSAFEVVVGAYLTQNTAWTNVERAMLNLRSAGVLSISGIRDIGLEALEQLVRPAGYFRQKTARLKNFVAYLDEHYGGSLDRMFAKETMALREELLNRPGIGPETADSILLYAANHEVFVVDAYTRRIFERHELAVAVADYDEIRLMVERALNGEAVAVNIPDSDLHAIRNERNDSESASQTLVREQLTIHAPSTASRMNRSGVTQVYNEFHALLVQTAKHFCVKGTPKCQNCPLLKFLPKPLAPMVPKYRSKSGTKLKNC